MNPISNQLQETQQSQTEQFGSAELESPQRGHCPDSSVTALDRWLVRFMARRTGSPPVQIFLWDGRPVLPACGSPHVNLRIHDRATLLKLCVSPAIQFGEAYAQGRITVDENLTRFLEICYRTFPAPGWISRLKHRWRMRRAHSLSTSRRNIHHHYDLGEEFYQLWLDEQLLYTCAYFPDSGLSLEEAQLAKMEHVCRKLQLQPGQSVIEAGCGWGALARYMAREYDVHVKAYNISHEQLRYARDLARQEGLSEKVEFIEGDWRQISGRCDAFVSIGMLEHVGVENYPLLGDVIYRSLKPDGMALIHSIGKLIAEPLDPWIEHRIFPGAEPPSLKQMMDIFEGHRFSVLDVENLRLHYAQTLEHWLQRYQEHEDGVRELYDDFFMRTWRLYLAGSIAAFTTGSLQLFQLVFSHPDYHRLPRSRAALYTTEPQAGRPSSDSGRETEEFFP